MTISYDVGEQVSARTVFRSYSRGKKDQRKTVIEFAVGSVEGCVEPLGRILPNGEKHKTSKRMSNAI